MKNGAQQRSKFFSIKWVKNPRRHHPRLSVVVSKRIFKSAVKRNRIRRRVYEIARPFLIDAPAIDVVINVYAAEVLTASHDELTIQLLPLLRAAGLKSRNIH
jgi:ribonuclease P protein component